MKQVNEWLRIKAVKHLEANYVLMCDDVCQKISDVLVVKAFKAGYLQRESELK